MARSVIVLVGLAFLLSSCIQRMICPAYQSSYIYDKEKLRQKFSYFAEDTTPKILTASKNKYLIIESKSYKKKEQGLFNIPMKPVQPVIPDSIANPEPEPVTVDSTATESVTDSIYVISKSKEVRVIKYNPTIRQYYVEEIGFNVEEENYLWYLRDQLELPDVRLSRLQSGEGSEGTSGSATKEKKGITGFFKGLFKKKEKSVEEAPEPPAQQEEEFDFIDEDNNNQPGEEAAPEPQRRGIFNFRNRNQQEETPREEQVPEEPAQPQPDEDDGF